MKQRRKAIFATLIVLAGAYLAWSRSGRTPPAPAAPRTASAVSLGLDAGRGNVVGIEPWVDASDFASAANLRAKLQPYMEAARARGWLRANSVVVFPEYIGSWLVAAGEKSSVYAAPDKETAMTTVVASNLPAFAWNGLFARGRGVMGWASATVFQMKAAPMVRAYDEVFSGLARDFGVTLVAGTIVLPNASILGGRLGIGPGPLENVSVVYGRDGRAIAVVGKSRPTKEEMPFTRAAAVERLPVVDTPAGRMGLLICADSWFPECYARMKQQRADFLVVPSFGGTGGRWEKAWFGYSGWPNAANVERADVQKLTEREAWQKYALLGRFAEGGVRDGLNIFLRGKWWEYEPRAQYFAVAAGRPVTGPPAPHTGPAIINLWLSGGTGEGAATAP